jgi:hypothetical protein
MLNFLQGALAPFQTGIIRQVDASHPTLANDLINSITSPENITGF